MSESLIKQSEVLNTVACYVEGIGFLGTTTKAELPKIEFETLESKNGLGTKKIHTAKLKAMEAKFEINEVNAVYFAALKKRTEEVVLWVKTHSYSGKSENKFVATLKGQISAFESFTPEQGKETTEKFTLDVSFYKRELNDITQCLIDLDNGVCEIDGTDVWEEQRNHFIG